MSNPRTGFYFECANSQFCQFSDKGIIETITDRGEGEPFAVQSCALHCEQMYYKKGIHCAGVDMQSFGKDFNKYNGSKGDNINRKAHISNCTFYKSGYGALIPGCTVNTSYISCIPAGRRQLKANSSVEDAMPAPDASKDVTTAEGADVKPVAVDAEEKPLKKNL